MQIKATCQARQYSDQMICGACGLQWDVTDPEPPKCTTRRKPPKEEVPAPTPKGLPNELPADLAAEMFRTLQYARGTGCDGVEAMQRAYRLFLDRVEV